VISVIPTWAPVGTLIVVAFGAFVAWRNLTTAVKNQRETTAKNTFREFLKLCVDHPQLAYGNPSPDKKEQYEWFVAHFLFAAEEILKFSPDEWRPNLLLHASYHKTYLRDDERFRREDYGVYPPAVQALIGEAVGTA
jgi:hypothetical protein